MDTTSLAALVIEARRRPCMCWQATPRGPRIEVRVIPPRPQRHGVRELLQRAGRIPRWPRTVPGRSPRPAERRPPRAVLLHELVHEAQERTGAFAELPPCERHYPPRGRGLRSGARLSLAVRPVGRHDGRAPALARADRGNSEGLGLCAGTPHASVVPRFRSMREPGPGFLHAHGPAACRPRRGARCTGPAQGDVRRRRRPGSLPAPLPT